MYYIVMLKPDEKHQQVFGNERQFLEKSLTLKNTIAQYTPVFKGLQASDSSLNRMEIYSVGNFFDDRTFLLEKTVY